MKLSSFFSRLAPDFPAKQICKRELMDALILLRQNLLFINFLLLRSWLRFLFCRFRFFGWRLPVSGGSLFDPLHVILVAFRLSWPHLDGFVSVPGLTRNINCEKTHFSDIVIMFSSQCRTRQETGTLFHIWTLLPLTLTTLTKTKREEIFTL